MPFETERIFFEPMMHIVIALLSVLTFFSSRATACEPAEEYEAFWGSVTNGHFDFIVLAVAKDESEVFSQSYKYSIKKTWPLTDKALPLASTEIVAKDPTKRPGFNPYSSGEMDCTDDGWVETPVAGKKYILGVSLKDPGNVAQFEFSPARLSELDQAAKRKFKPISVERTLKQVSTLVTQDANKAVLYLKNEMVWADHLGIEDMKPITKQYFELRFFDHVHATPVFELKLASLYAKIENWNEAEKILSPYNEWPIAQFNRACYFSLQKQFSRSLATLDGLLSLVRKIDEPKLYQKYFKYMESDKDLKQLRLLPAYKNFQKKWLDHQKGLYSRPKTSERER